MTVPSNRWARPTPLKHIDAVFPEHAVGRLVPPANELSAPAPDSKWRALFDDWFYSGITHVEFSGKPGVDVRYAIRHLKAVSNCAELSHEHKLAAFAYLCEQWFEEARWQRKTSKN